MNPGQIQISHEQMKRILNSDIGLTESKLRGCRSQVQGLRELIEAKTLGFGLTVAKIPGLGMFLQGSIVKLEGEIAFTEIQLKGLKQRLIQLDCAIVVPSLSHQ